MNIIFVLLSPLLVIISFVVIKVLFFTVRYLSSKSHFDKLPRTPGGWCYVASYWIEDNHTLTYPGKLIEAFPSGIPPILFGGPGLNGYPTIVVHDPAALRVVSNDVLFPKLPMFYDSVSFLVGNGLIVSKGEHWKHQRDLINPLFHAGKLKEFTEAMIMAGQAMVDTLKATKGAPVEVGNVAGKASQKALIDALFSGKLDGAFLQKVWESANDALAMQLIAGMAVGFYLNNLPIWPWTRKIAASRALIRNKIQELIDGAIKNKENKENKEGDFIEYLVANGCPSDVICEETQTILFAGQDTTKNTISWFLYFMGENPSILQRLQQEVDDELKGEVPTFSDISKLRFLRCAFNEVLRMVPPAPALERVAAEDTILCGTLIPKNTNVSMRLHGPMMDPKYWKDPLTFNPDRFDEELQYTQYWMPFSLGERNCVGQKFALQEEILIGAMLVQHFDIHRCTEFPVRARLDGSLQPKGLHCKFIERNPNKKKTEQRGNN